MAKRDVIISALACGGKMSCRKEADKFKDPPVVININSGTGVSTGGGTVEGFRKAAKEYKTNGSILEGVLSTQKDLKPRRICLVSYLAGWSFINEILKTDDFEMVDTVIVLEGLNSRSKSVVDTWSKYANYSGHLIMACTDYQHKTASSKSVAKNIFIESEPNQGKEIPGYIKGVNLDKSISIYSKAETPKTKIFHEDTLKRAVSQGSTTYLQYSGKQAQDQTYIQQYVQPRIWRWLKEEWK